MLHRKNSILVLVGLVLAGGAGTAHADSQCYVTGHHRPGTNEYHGPTTCTDIVLSNLTVRGPSHLFKTTVSGATVISGPMEASGSHFQSIISENGQPKVTLTADTVVDGDITFTTLEEGTVVIDASSVIKGKVNHGSIIKK